MKTSHYHKESPTAIRRHNQKKYERNLAKQAKLNTAEHQKEVQYLHHEEIKDYFANYGKDNQA